MEHRLHKACEYVSDLWFPVNPALLSRMRKSLETPDETNMDVLLGELQGDFSLFFFCLREMLKLLKSEGIEPPNTSNAVDLFRFGGIERLQRILQTETISRHSFDAMSATQRSRLEEVVISASTAQVLAEHASLDSEAGLSAALMRQLGYTLIAWNYPDVYEKSMQLMKTENLDLDMAITKTLGFSPSVLAITLAQSWGFPADMAIILEDQEDDDLSPDETYAVGAMLAKLCRIGEALARANNPERYPSARRDWSKAKNEITKRLGEQGLSLIKDALTENCQSYIWAAPNMFKPGFILDPEAYIEAYEKNELNARNPYLGKCDPGLERQLRQVYKMLEAGAPAENLLRILTKEVLHFGGFNAAAVYTMEPASRTLVPQLVMPALKKRPQIVSAEADHPSANHITTAYHSDEPLVGPVDEDISYVCGLFGFAQRLGVLYLEFGASERTGRADTLVINFKALALALNDCLELS